MTEYEKVVEDLKAELAYLTKYGWEYTSSSKEAVILQLPFRVLSYSPTDKYNLQVHINHPRKEIARYGCVPVLVGDWIALNIFEKSYVVEKQIYVIQDYLTAQLDEINAIMPGFKPLVEKQLKMNDIFIIQNI